MLDICNALCRPHPSVHVMVGTMLVYSKSITLSCGEGSDEAHRWKVKHETYSSKNVRIQYCFGPAHQAGGW